MKWMESKGKSFIKPNGNYKYFMQILSLHLNPHITAIAVISGHIAGISGISFCLHCAAAM